VRVCDVTADVEEGRAASQLDPRAWYRSAHATDAASRPPGRADRRRRDWVGRKQKSKSFDFCWQSGMWSPIDRPTTGGGDDIVGPSSRPPLQPSAVHPGLSAAAGDVATTAVSTTNAPAPLPSTSAVLDAEECRRTSPRLKLPPMFHMDSGSSFESYEPGEGILQHQLLQVSLSL